jgi:hypothetical protein
VLFCNNEIQRAHFALAMVENGAEVELPDPVAWRSHSPVIRVAVPVFVGLQLALGRKEKLNLAGRWLRECDDPACSHEYCGRRMISFGWFNKRTGGKPIGNYILHLPKKGSTSDISEAYDPKRLTIVDNERLMGEALPDKLEWLSREENPASILEANFEELILGLSTFDGSDDDIAGPDDDDLE